MTQTAVLAQPIAFAYEPDGQICCKNQRGLTFFLKAEPPKPAAKAPSWKPVAPTQEVEVRRHSEPQPVSKALAPAASQQPQPEPEQAPTPASQAQAESSAGAGWFKKLFTK